MFDEVAPGVLHVRYDTGESLAVARQAPLVARLEERRGPLVLVFEVGPDVRLVPVDVPTFWLSTTGRLELLIRGVGIISNSVAVKVAARGFAIANRVRRVQVQVELFEDLPRAMSWATALAK